MSNGFQTLSEPLIQIGDNHVLNRDQMLTEVKCSKVCFMTTRLGSEAPLTLTLLWVWWGRCERNYLPKEEGRGKKAHAARPPGPGLEPGTCRVPGEGPQLHATGVVWTSKPFRAHR